MDHGPAVVQRCITFLPVHRFPIQIIFQALRLYEQYHVLNNNGDSVQHLNSSKSAEDARILRRVHEALVEIHADALRKIGQDVIEDVKRTLPDSAILSIWDQRAAGIETGCHSPRAIRTQKSTVFPDNNGINPEDVPHLAMRPLAQSPDIFVANEAFGHLHCFAEGSLVMAENIIHTGFNISRPSWISTEEYKKIIFNKTHVEKQWKPHPMGDVYFTGPPNV